LFADNFKNILKTIISKEALSVGWEQFIRPDMKKIERVAR
jgi:hypothetical protein